MQNNRGLRLNFSSINLFKRALEYLEICYEISALAIGVYLVQETGNTFPNNVSGQNWTLVTGIGLVIRYVSGAKRVNRNGEFIGFEETFTFDRITRGDFEIIIRNGFKTIYDTDLVIDKFF